MLFWLALPHPLAAQTTNTPTSTITIDQVNAVAREMWCPLCSGVRLDTCDLKACEQMRQEIAIKLAAGENTESIKKYFLAQYGPQILGEPPRQGFNWIAWILPFAALLVSGVILLMRGRRLFMRTAPVNAAAPTPATDDPYTRRLEEELKQYD
jgi:cytochrome c-type biogenesis protein CcmH